MPDRENKETKDEISRTADRGIPERGAVPGSGNLPPDLSSPFEKLQTATPEGLRTKGKTHAGIGDAIDRMLGITEDEFQKWQDGDIPDNPRFKAAADYSADLHHAVIGFDDREANSILDKIRAAVTEKDYPEPSIKFLGPIETGLKTKSDIEARLKSGELVPAGLVNQHPDLARKYLPPWEWNFTETPIPEERVRTGPLSADDKQLIGTSYSQLTGAEAGGRRIVEGEERAGRYGSSYPDWFSNKGWTRKEVEAAYEKAMQDKPLTDRQKSIVAGMLENAEKYLEHIAGADWRQQWESLKSEHGAASLDIITSGMKPFIEQDVIPTAKSLARTMVETGAQIKDALSPASAGELAQKTAIIMRGNLAEMARKGDQAEAALNKVRKFFAKQDERANIDFIDGVERGEKQTSADLDSTAKIMRQMFDERVEQIRALGTGKLQNVIENYFPHIWKDPKKAESFLARWFGKGPLEGSRAFLKKRSVPTTLEGLNAGLEPVSTNPVDLTLMKLRELDKYIMAHKTLNTLKQEGLVKFVRIGNRGPDGWVRISDRIGTVYGPSEIKVKEAFDERLVEGLSRVAADLGVTTERKARIGGKRWGYQQTAGTPEVVTKFAGPESVLAHELGHAIDDRHGVHRSLFGGERPKADFIIDRQIAKLERENGPQAQIDKLVRQKTINKELRDLADLRFEGKDVSKSSRR
jgi:hypothetical protein